MNQHERTLSDTAHDTSDTAQEGGNGRTTETTEQRQQDRDRSRRAAMLARSSADHRSRADAALGDADAARGNAAEAEGRGEADTAGAEWSDAAGLDGLAAHEATVSDIDARAAAAVSKSTTIPPAQKGRGRGRTGGEKAGGQGRTSQPPPGPPRRIP